RVLDELAGAGAVVARAADREEALLVAHLAEPRARRAGHPRRAGGRARPRAVRARLEARDAYLLRYAREDLLERDLEVVAKVGTPPRRGAAPRAAEDVAEDVA